MIQYTISSWGRAEVGLSFAAGMPSCLMEVIFGLSKAAGSATAPESLLFLNKLLMCADAWVPWAPAAVTVLQGVHVDEFN